MHHRFLVRLFLTVTFTVITLGACSPANNPVTTIDSSPQTTTVIDTSAPPGSSNPSASAAIDCGWSRTLRAWIDTNQNGVWDTNEKPLEGVTFLIHDTVSNSTARSFPSDSQGVVNQFLLLGGCPNVAFEVSAETPSNYKATTPMPIRSNLANNDEEFSFGFAPSN